MQVARRAGTVAVLAWLAIEIHEAGHWLAYRALGHSAWLSFQRVTPTGAVPTAHDFVAKLAGPLVSLTAAALGLLVARHRPTFGWVTAAFTNASLRLFPLVMDIIRALRGARPFSDEGEIGIALGARLGTLVVFLTVAGALSFFAARLYRFDRPVPKVALIYLGSFAIGIATVLADDFLGLNQPPVGK